MYQTRHRTRAVSGIETVRSHPFPRRLIQFYDHTFLGKLTIQLVDKFINDKLDHIDIESLERHPGIQTVTKLRRKCAFDDAFRISLCIGSVAEADAARRK